MPRSATARGLKFAAALAALVASGDPSAASAREGRAIQLAPGRAQVVPLPADAGAVVVGNPANLTAMLDTPRTMILVPHQPGLTSLTVLDRRGEMMLNSDIVVTAKQSGSVNVVRSCTEDSKGCKPVTTFYCGAGCIEITPPEAGKPPSESMPALANEDKPAEKRQP